MGDVDVQKYRILRISSADSLWRFKFAKKKKKVMVCKSPSAHHYVRDNDFHYILCFLGDIGYSEEKL